MRTLALIAGAICLAGPVSAEPSRLQLSIWGNNDACAVDLESATNFALFRLTSDDKEMELIEFGEMRGGDYRLILYATDIRAGSLDNGCALHMAFYSVAYTDTEFTPKYLLNANLITMPDGEDLVIGEAIADLMHPYVR